MTQRALLPCLVAWMLIGGAVESSGQGAAGQIRALGVQLCQEAESGRMWQVEKARGVATAREAELQAAGLQLGGYDDWRLPTKAEMFNLAKIFFWHKNNDCRMDTRGDYWLVDDGRQPSLGHWEIDFACGPVYRYIKASRSRGSVRAVRP